MVHMVEAGRPPALCDAKERIGKASTQNNMGAAEIELLLSHPSRKYKAPGKDVVVHFDIASFRSRRQDRCVARVGVEKGEVAKRGVKGLGGWGSAKCASWISGSPLIFGAGWKKRDAGEPCGR